MSNESSDDSVLASVLASYSKQWIDSALYDRLERTAWMRRVRKLAPSTRRGAEFALIAISAFLKERIGERRFWQRVAAEVIGDAGLELGKRLIAETRMKLRHALESAEDAEIAAALLELDDSKLYAVLRAVAEPSTVRTAPKSGSRVTQEGLIGEARVRPRSQMIEEDLARARERLRRR